MLGSLQDAEDALQDILQALARPRRIRGAGLGAHLAHRIATNRCLSVLRSARRRPAKEWDMQLDLPEPTRLGEIVWLEPYADALLEAALPLDPEARYEQTEAVSLAFVTALQVLPARLRTVLILREVLGYHGNEWRHARLDRRIGQQALKRARASCSADCRPRAKTGRPRRRLTRRAGAGGEVRPRLPVRRCRCAGHLRPRRSDSAADSGGIPRPRRRATFSPASSTRPGIDLGTGPPLSEALRTRRPLAASPDPRRLVPSTPAKDLRPTASTATSPVGIASIAARMNHAGGHRIRARA